MLDRLFGTRVHDLLHFLGLTSIAIGMPFGKAFMSMGMLLLIANFLLEVNFKSAIHKISANRLLIGLIGFFLLLIVGLIWSSDAVIGLKEIKSRLPMLAIPLIIGARNPLTKKEVAWLLYFFISSLLITSFYNYLSYSGIIGHRVYDDVRGMSLFGSHIRYGIVIAIGTGVCIHQQFAHKKFQIIYTAIAFWFIYYTYYSEILTGALSMLMVFAATIIYLLWVWKKWVAILTKIILTGIATFIVISLFNFKTNRADLSTLPASTINGNLYYHTNEAFSEINGEPLFTFYCEKELRSEWNRISTLNFIGNDKNDHLLRTTIARYMTAINVTKDSLGFQQLSAEDIKNIEQGYTYPNEQSEHVLSRINGIRYQLINNNDPNGHSLLQRFEYWKASIYVIKKHWLIGVGTGGNQRALDQAYNDLNSKLKEVNRCRSHNMYMSYFISYGIFGLIAFITLLSFILLYTFRNHYLLGIQFLAVMVASFLIEDTLETQMGVTIFGFFLGLIINEMNLNRSNTKKITNV